MNPILIVLFTLSVLIALFIVFSVTVGKLKHIRKSPKDTEKLIRDSRSGLKIAEHREKLIGLKNSEPWIDYLSNGGFGI